MSPTIARPNDAAGLVLIRDRLGDPEVLMGRRHRKARFMPDVYVFPGGRLTAADRRPSGFPEASAAQPAGLDAVTRRRLPAFARAALRETFEETGVLLGRAATGAQSTPARASGADGAPAQTSHTGARGAPAQDVWASYRAAGLAPAFEGLSIVARAITPTSSPIRFHTRFFMADGAVAQAPDGGDGELEDVHWVPLSQIRRLPLPAEVTLLVLGEALIHWRDLKQRGRRTRRHAALFRWSGTRERSRHRRDPDPLRA